MPEKIEYETHRILRQVELQKWPANAAEAERRLECRDRVTAPFLFAFSALEKGKKVTPTRQPDPAKSFDVICAGRSHVSISTKHPLIVAVRQATIPGASK